MAVRYGIDEDRDEQDANELRHQLQVKETYKYSNLKGEAADSQRCIEFFRICYHLLLLLMVQAHELKVLEKQLLIGKGS